jgi:hypothetical protein
MIFCLVAGSTTVPSDGGLVGVLAAGVMAHAIVRAVRQATSIPGYPAARDLQH